MRIRSQTWCGSNALWVLVALAALVAGCAMPELKRDLTYPAGWPEIAGAGVNCLDLAGTYVNKGTVVDARGQVQEHWLTVLLPFNDFVRVDDPALEARRATKNCERVTIAVEHFTWPNRPDAKFCRLVVQPNRPDPAAQSGESDPCAPFRLPADLGYPWEGQILSSCTQNVLLLMHESGGAGPIPPPAQRYEFVLAADRSLIVKLDAGRYLLDHSGWARFERVH